MADDSQSGDSIGKRKIVSSTDNSENENTVADTNGDHVEQEDVSQNGTEQSVDEEDTKQDNNQINEDQSTNDSSDLADSDPVDISTQPTSGQDQHENAKTAEPQTNEASSEKHTNENQDDKATNHEIQSEQDEKNDHSSILSTRNEQTNEPEITLTDQIDNLEQENNPITLESPVTSDNNGRNENDDENNADAEIKSASTESNPDDENSSLVNVCEDQLQNCSSTTALESIIPETQSEGAQFDDNSQVNTETTKQTEEDDQTIIDLPLTQSQSDNIDNVSLATSNDKAETDATTNNIELETVEKSTVSESQVDQMTDPSMTESMLDNNDNLSETNNIEPVTTATMSKIEKDDDDESLVKMEDEKVKDDLPTTASESTIPKTQSEEDQVDGDSPLKIETMKQNQNNDLPTIDSEKRTDEIEVLKVSNSHLPDTLCGVSTETENEFVSSAIPLENSLIEHESNTTKIDSDVFDEQTERAPEVIDILGNKTLLKQTLVQGIPNTRPTRSTMATISYDLSLVDNATANVRLIETISNKEIFISEHDIIVAIDICLQQMDRGEKALITADVRHCYGEIGCEEKGIPSINENNSYKMEINLQLHDWKSPTDIQLLSVDERILRGNTKKDMGNFYYRRKEYSPCLQSYRGALRFFDTDSNPLPSSHDENQNLSLVEGLCQVLNNIAQVNLQLQRYEECLNAVERILRYDPKNAKALFRQGKALFESGKYEQALKSLKQLENCNDKNTVNEMISVCEKKLSEYHKNEKEIYKRMFQPTANARSNEINRNNQLNTGNRNWWPYVALGSAAIAAIGFATFIKFRKIS